MQKRELNVRSQIRYEAGSLLSQVNWFVYVYLCVPVFMPCMFRCFCRMCFGVSTVFVSVSAVCVCVGISVCLFPVFFCFFFEVFYFLCKDMCRPFYALGL